MKYDIGDIVFVANYKYKSNESGNKHIFVIVDERQAVELNYFGFLLSSKIEKSKYPYNEELKKNNTNKLRKDSIVKCDDLIELENKEILFKIGTVEEEELIRFLDTYERYLENN